MSDTYQDRWPKCANYDECGGRIYLAADPVTGKPRTVCAGCETRGLAPATALPPLPQPYSNRKDPRT